MPFRNRLYHNNTLLTGLNFRIMKIYHYLLALAACSAMLLSCKKDGPADDPDDGGDGTETPVPPVTGEPEAMTFTLTPEAVSGIDGYDNAWAAGDCISLFEGAANNKFEFSADNKFDGSAVASGAYFALYPYDENAKLENNALTIEIPAEQTGELTDMIAIGYSTSEDIAMKNATGLLKFTLEEDNVTKVTISGNDGQILAGTVSVSWNNGEPTVSAAEGGSATVSVGDGETILEKGEYYVNIVPVKMVGYTVTFTYKNDESTYESYFEKWENGMTKDSGVKGTYTRGASEFPLVFSEGPVNMTRGKLFELQETLSATLVYYDDEIKTTINGVPMTAACWDNYDESAGGGSSWTDACTTAPYEGSKCFQWTMGQDWGLVGFQTFRENGDPEDQYRRGNLDLTSRRNAHFSLQFAYKADPETKFYVRFMQHRAGFTCLNAIKDLSEYATGEWELVTIPLDEMKVSEYASQPLTWDTVPLEKISVDDGTFDSEGNPFRWDKIVRTVFAFSEDMKDMSQKGKTVYIDDIKITKVIISDQTAE